MKASININSTIKRPSPAIRILGVQIDSKLKWGPHLKFIQGKMSTQTLALSRLTTSTWGACFAKAKLLYSAVVRPAITFGSTVWHSPCGAPDNTRKTDKLLSDVQRECLRVVSGGFRATPQPIIEAETNTMPMQLHLGHLQAKCRRRLKEHNHENRVKTFCEKIQRKLTASKGRRRRNAGLTPGMRKRKWYENLTAKLIESNQQREPTDKELRNAFVDQWKQQWDVFMTAQRRGNACAALEGDISAKRLRIHQSMSKPESSLITQMRTERIGLADYLFRRRVPTITSPTCTCGHARQTLRHVLTGCPDHRTNRGRMFIAAGTTDYRRLLSTPKGLKAAANWLMKTNLLTQFSLAAEGLPCPAS